MKQKNNKIVFVLIIVIAMAAGGYYLINKVLIANDMRTSSQSHTPPNKRIEANDKRAIIISDIWKTFEYDGIKYSYPSNWEVQRVTYSTPVQQAKGAISTIGFDIIPDNVSYPSNDVIHIGGRHISCDDQQFAPSHLSRCLDNESVGLIYTISQNQQILNAFNLIVQNTLKQSDYQEEKWETYTSIEYDFEIKYPKDWEAKKTENLNPVLMLVSPERRKRLEETGGYEMETSDIHISIFESARDLYGNEKENLPLELWFQKNKLGFYEMDKLTLAGSPAFRGMSGSFNEGDPYIYVEHKGRIYLIVSELGGEIQRIQNEKIINTFAWVD